MNNLTKTIIACVVVFVVGFVLGGVGKVPAGLGATVYNRVIEFSEGITVDGTERISGTGGASFTTGAFSSTLAATGATTLSNDISIAGKTVISEASSTVQVGDTSSGIGVGCLILGDSAGATSTPVYITATGETISATTTKPSICQ